VNSGSKLGSRS